MRCGECQHWSENQAYGTDVGSCALFTAHIEGGASAPDIEDVNPRLPYVGYEGWTATHRNFYCAGFKRVETHAQT